MRSLLFVCVALFGFSGQAWAWGDTGHKVVCQIALLLVGDETRNTIKDMIKEDTEFTNFADACTYPDHPRKREPEHFINLARDAKQLDSDECPEADKCLLTAIPAD